MSDEKIELQNRKYVGEIKEDGFIYYYRTKNFKQRDGTYKMYDCVVKRKRGKKLNKRGKGKKTLKREEEERLKKAMLPTP